jgi:hypothetical protein
MILTEATSENSMLYKYDTVSFYNKVAWLNHQAVKLLDNRVETKENLEYHKLLLYNKIKALCESEDFYYYIQDISDTNIAGYYQVLVLTPLTNDTGTTGINPPL